MISGLKEAAVIFIINNNNEVLLYRRINTWYEPNKLALIGGNVDEGETPEETVKREVFEETDIVVKSLEPVVKITDNEYEVYYFLAQDWYGEPINKEPDRCGGLSWHNLKDLPEDTIEEIKDTVNSHVAFR